MFLHRIVDVRVPWGPVCARARRSASVCEVSDAELLAAWGGGDQSAGETLFDRHFESVARFFRNKAGGAHDDLIQLTFLGCVEARDRFRGDASFRSFLFAIARNVLFKHYRSQRRERDRMDFGLASVHDLADSPSVVVARSQDQRLVLEALRRIPMDAQVALELVYWEELTGAEIAAVLDIPLGTAKTRIRRARQLFELELAALREDHRLPEPTQTDLEQWAKGLRQKLF